MKVEKLKKISRLIDRNIKLFLNFLLSFLVYWLGIGPTSLVAKLTGKKFIKLLPKNSSWQKYHQSKELEKMY